MIGSGEGYSTIIDSDVIFDDIGIPYIPARRIKGLLRESAEDVIQIAKSAFPSLNGKNSIIKDLFGDPGQEEPAPLIIPNFYTAEYFQSYAWLSYYLKHNDYGKIISKESIVNSFTRIRKNTSIENGVAKEHSLRTIRVVNKGITFKGTAKLTTNDSKMKNIFILSCLNLRTIGTKRNRGLGEIECEIESINSVNAQNLLEVLCAA